MSQVVDIITWVAYEAGLRAYLGVAAGEDENLQLWLQTAAELADDFLEREDLTDPLQSKIVVGVYELVKALREAWSKAYGTKKVQTDRLAQEIVDAVIGSAEYEWIANRFWRFEAERLWNKA